MKITRTNRTLTAWMLYASILFSLFACSIHHGQMAGLALSGLSGGYCAMDASGGMGQGSDDAGQLKNVAAQFSCPLCSTSGMALAVNSLGWQVPVMAQGALSPVVVRSWAQPPPRYLWPSLNPRAPPSLFPAVNPTV